MKILVVDDDVNIVNLISITLAQQGYSVLRAFNGMEALALFDKDIPDLAIIDVMMPEMNGYTLTKKIRERFEIPILFLTAKGALEDKVRGFSVGADDYVVKPFEPKELLFRVAAILRRYDKVANTVFQVADVCVNSKTYEVIANDKTMLMPLKEFEILALLASKVGQVFTRSRLMELVWGFDYDGDEQTLTTHIKRLRERLAKLSSIVKIQTIRGIGYKLEVIQ